jgi:hypothetical protein
MKAMEVTRMALGFADRGLQFLETMKDAPLVQPGPFGGNHPMWTAGHLTVMEGRLHKILFGIPNPVEHWKPLFDWGSEPQMDGSAYPPFEEVLQTFRKLRARTVAFLDEIGDEGLDQPTKTRPPGMEPGFSTVGQAVMTMVMHQTFHNGEAAVARRASGKPPVFIPTKQLREF